MSRLIQEQHLSTQIIMDLRINNMKNSCIIKSHPKGISVILDETVPFEQLVYDICEVFAKSKDFFGNGELILSLEGRTLTPQETMIVVEAIELNTNTKVPLIIDDSEIRDVRTVGALDKYYFEKSDSNAKIIRGNVNSGQVITSDTGVLVLGDVKKNAQIIARGNVCVMGKLEGDVRAGEPDGINACIVAGIMLAKSATIGGITNEINIKYRGFRKSKQKTEPVVVKLLHGFFHAEPLSGGLVTQDN